MKAINKELNFVIGIGRSGTTLLIQLLNQYPAIHCLPEANFLVFFLHAYKNKTNFSQNEIEMVFEQISIYSKSNPWVGWNFNLEKTKNEILNSIKNGNNFNYETLCKFIYQNFEVKGIDKKNATILLDKNPSYTLFVENIRSFLPNAKYILILRDYRANVLSRKQSFDVKTVSVFFNAFRWKLFNKIAIRFYEKNQNKVLLLRYEDLVANSELEITKVLDFLGVEKKIYESQMQPLENFYDYNIPEQFKARFNKKYSDLNKPIKADRLDAWKEQLTEQEISGCDAICHPFAARFKYAPFSKKGFSVFFKIKHCFSFLKAILNIRKDYLNIFSEP